MYNTNVGDVTMLPSTAEYNSIIHYTVNKIFCLFIHLKLFKMLPIFVREISDVHFVENKQRKKQTNKQTNKMKTKQNSKCTDIPCVCKSLYSWTPLIRTGLFRILAISNSNPFPLDLSFSHLLSAISNSRYFELFSVSRRSSK